VNDFEEIELTPTREGSASNRVRAARKAWADKPRKRPLWKSQLMNNRRRKPITLAGDSTPGRPGEP
jgi:hypothetical protein